MIWYIIPSEYHISTTHHDIIQLGTWHSTPQLITETSCFETVQQSAVRRRILWTQSINEVKAPWINGMSATGYHHSPFSSSLPLSYCRKTYGLQLPACRIISHTKTSWTIIYFDATWHTLSNLVTVSIPCIDALPDRHGTLGQTQI